MRHLNLFIGSDNNFDMAVDFFQNESDFTFDQKNDEFRCLSFPVVDQDDANSLEPLLESEVDHLFIMNYHFEFA